MGSSPTVGALQYIVIMNNEIESLVIEYERKLESERRWVGALFQLLKEAGIQPSSRELLDAMRRVDDESRRLELFKTSDYVWDSEFEGQP